MLTTAFLLVIPTTFFAQAVQFYTNSTVPANISTSCTNALLADVGCDPVVPALRSGEFYPANTLERACTSGCSDALQSYQNVITSACNNDVWLGYDNETMPVNMIPELLRFHFNLTCLVKNGEFCNNIAAAYAEHLDPDATGDSGMVHRYVT